MEFRGISTVHKDGAEWNQRAGSFNKLEWTQKADFLETFVRACQCRAQDCVLDVGTGTGIIARSLASRVREVVGIDISEAMIKAAQGNGDNCKFVLMEAEDLLFKDASFDLVTARMSFHHIENVPRAMSEAYRVLKAGGRMVLCEGVPPDHYVHDRYVEIFKLKEKRHTFSEALLINYFRQSGFEEIELRPFFMEQVSLNNWLDNSGLPQDTCEKIKRLHLESDDYFKQVYNMSIADGDIYLDWKFVIVSGLKPTSR